MNTKRSFDFIKIVNLRQPNHHVISRFHELFLKFSADIKRLDIASSVLKENEVTALLQLLPNLQEISFYDVEFCDFDSSTDMHLHNLRKFNFSLCNVKIPEIICKLPRNVLRSISIENSILKGTTLQNIFENQPSVQELSFDPYYVLPAAMEHLRLRKVKLMCNRNVAAILKSQSHLDSVDLSKAHIGDAEFLEICKMKSLTSLKLWIDRVSWEIFGSLAQLTNLKELQINYERLEIEYVRSISRINMPSVEKLKVKVPRLKITAESFVELSLNMANVRYLSISNQSVGVLKTLVENFKNLESLVFGCDSDSSEVVDFAPGVFQHDKLRELCIYSSFESQKALKCSKSILHIINSSLKNLQKLKLQNVIALSADQLDELLRSHSQMSHFFIDHPDGGEAEFNEPWLDVLRENPHRLSFFESRGANISVPKKVLEKQFRSAFPVIKIKPWRKLVVLRTFRWEHGDD